MKNISIISILISLILLLDSCSGFLDYKEDDKMIPETIENFSELLLGEVIYKGDKDMNFISLMSDDVTDIVRAEIPVGWSDPRDADLHYYRWNQDLEKNYNGDYKVIKSWFNFYHKILMCNVIINEINNLDEAESTKNEKFILEGECYFLKANAYFNLVNLYGEPYKNAEQAKTALGVCVNNEIGVSDKFYSRESLQTIYDLIEDYLLTSIDLFKEYPREFTSIFRPNLEASYLLLSRVYLYQKKYDKVIETATELINNTGFYIYNLNEFNPESDCFSKHNTGIMFSFEEFDYPDSFKESGNRFMFRASSDLIKLYSMDDLRKSAYFAYDYNFPTKCTRSKRSVRGKNFRIEEAYLNRAEAYAEKGDIDKAIKDIKEIRKNKFSQNYEVNAESKEEAVNIVRKERRRELCFELHRWFDLRRYGCPRIVHPYTPQNDTDPKFYVLEENSPNYTLALPFELTKIDSDIRNNQRVEINLQDHE